MAVDTKACVACAEEIRAKAVLCKFCKTRQDDQSFTSPIEIQADVVTERRKLQKVLLISVSGSIVFVLALWAVLAAVFSGGEGRGDEEATSSQAAVNDTAPVSAEGLNPSNEGSNTLSPSNENSGQPNRSTETPPQSTESQPQANDLQAQQQEALREIAEQAAIWEAESRARAIEEYETKLNNYLGQIAVLEGQKQQVYNEESAAYAQWEAKWGFPYNRRDNAPCGYTSDMFACINEHATMPQYWFTISGLDSQIRGYEIQIDALVYPY